MKFKFILLACLFFAFSAVFAQNEQKIAVYATGELGVNEKKAFSAEMLSFFTGSGKYKAIENMEAFFDGLQEYEKSSALEPSQIIAFGKQLGVQFVCLINIIPVFGSYHVSARIIDTETSEVLTVGTAGSELKSHDDLANVSSELATQLLQSNEPAAIGALPVGVAAASQQCDKKYNINELLAQIQYGFPSQLKDCGSSFAKDLALSKVPFSKTEVPKPKSYMMQCTMDGIKSRLPEGFPGVDKVIDDVQGFINNILNAAMAGASLNPTKLASAIGDMKIDELLNGIKNLKNGACIVDEPYKYVEPVKEAQEIHSDGKKKGDFFTFGIRMGLNFSHLYRVYDNGRYTADGTYNDVLGFQAGMVFDFAVSEVFHLQPGIMYIQKGTEYDNHGNYGNLTSHNIEIPLLLSLKFSEFRINVGPYLGSGGDGERPGYWDYGISTGLGFDIGGFYIGMFYEYGLMGAYGMEVEIKTPNVVGTSACCSSYNRTLGFNLGVNL